MTRGLASLLIVVAVALGAGPAAADKTYLHEADAAGAMFPAGKAATRKLLELSRPELEALGKALGWRVEGAHYPYLEVTLNEVVLGWIFLLDVIGQAQPITFAVAVTRDGLVHDVRVMVYRETHGAEIEDARFRKQFVGKSLKDPIVLGKDIDAITGATISSRAETVAVRKTLVLTDLLRNQRQRKP
ncbi:MAG: FMN-binding protein [Kofleriaceae bacterium]